MSTVKVDKIEGSTGNQFQIPKGIAYSANVSGNVSVSRSLAVGYTDGRVPQANLEVKGNTYITGEVSVQDSSQQLYLRPNSTSDHGWIINNDATDGTLDFTRRGGQNVGPTNNVRMAISQVGDVGIGTVSPSAFGGTTLDVFDEKTYSALLVRSGARSMEIITSAQHSAAGMGTRSNHDLNLLTNDTAQALLSTAGDLTLNSGSLIFGAANEGVYLGVTSATAANLLDDYEEGTLTPAFTSTSATFAYTTQGGNYTKVGRMCLATFRLELDGNAPGGTTSNSVFISGLPFAIATLADTYHGTSIGHYFGFDLSTAGIMCCQLASSASTAELKVIGDNLGETAVLASAAGSAAQIRGQIVYQTA